MISTYVPDNVKETLNAVTPHFEEYLQEKFINGHRRTRETHTLDSIFVSDGNINIYLSNLHLPALQFQLNKFQVNLEMFNVYMEANLGHLIVEGNVEESAIGEITHTSKNGKIMFVLEDVAFSVNIGIYIVEDSFLAKNYDISMKPARISSKVTWDEGDQVLNFESSEINIEKSLVNHIWAPIINLFHSKILYYQFGDAIVERSVSELLIDEPDEMIFMSADRASKCNGIVDSMLNIMNTFFEVSKQSVLRTPSLIISIPVEGSENGYIESAHGEFQNISTFVRVGDMSMYENEGVQYIFGNIQLKFFRFNYVDCKAKHGANSSSDATIKIGAYRSNIFIKLSLQRNGEAINMSIEEVKVLRIMDVNFDMYNLECLSSIQQQMRSWVLGSLQGLAYPVLEEKIKEGLTYAIQNRNV